MTYHKYLTDTELALVEGVLAKYRATDVRNVLMFDLLLSLGCRASELLNVRPLDLNPTDRSVFLRTLKGGVVREIPLSRSMFARLSSYSATVTPDQRVFPISYSRLEKLWLHYRPLPKPLHSLRHTFAIRALRRTKDVRLVQRALGHRSLMTTTIYLDYMHTVDEMRKLLPDELS